MPYTPDCGAVASPAVSIVGMTVCSPSLGFGVVTERPTSMDALHRRILNETEADWPYVKWAGPGSPVGAGLANPLELTAVGVVDKNPAAL